MAKKTTTLFPKVQELLSELGENIRLARLRRKITAKLTAQRAGISVTTLTQIEQGSPSVAIGNYMQVLMTLNLEQDMSQVAKDDELGRKLQDIGLSVKKRAPKRGAK